MQARDQFPALAMLDSFDPGRLRVFVDKSEAWLKHEHEDLLLLAFGQGIHPGTCKIVHIDRNDIGRRFIEITLDLSKARPMTPEEREDIHRCLDALGAVRFEAWRTP